jgi:hypothetical protein
VTFTLTSELIGELESGETVNYGMRPAGLETKNDRAGEGQQQFNRVSSQFEASRELTAEVGGWQLEVSPSLELAVEVPAEARRQSMRLE